MDERELRQIGPYPVIRFLSEGGMAWVYEVTDPRFGVRRALKMLKPDAAGGAEFQRFEAEARILAGIEHPNLVTIYDFGRDPATGCHYYTMSFIDGPSGSELGDVGVERAAEIVLDALDGLAALHAQGVVHRDVKPGNLLVDRASGRAQLADLGIARVEASSGLTRTGTMIGTALYMSPEQARGRPVDRSSDVFSMGLTLYRLLTGRVAYDDVKDLDTTSGVEVVMYLGSLVHSGHELHFSFPASVPPALRRVVLRACRVDAESRYPDALAMRRALSDALDEVRARRARRRSRRRPWAAALLLAAGAAGAGAWLRPDLVAPLRGEAEAWLRRLAPAEARGPVRPEARKPAPPAAPRALRRPAPAPAVAPEPAPTPEALPSPAPSRPDEEPAPPPPAPAAPPSPAPPRPDEARIRALLDRAAQEVAADRLTSPAGDNALETYRQVLALAPDDPRAQRGLGLIRTRYLEWGERAEERGDLERALGHYQRALEVAPGDADASFRASFVADRIEAEKQRAREQKLADAQAAAAAAEAAAAPSPTPAPTARAGPAAPTAPAAAPQSEPEATTPAGPTQLASSRASGGDAPPGSGADAGAPEGMVRVPAGSLPAARGRPATPVAAFDIDRTEVTVDDYRACVEAGACKAVTRNAACNDSHADRGHHPANCVDFNQAKAYCEWRGERLPTGAEWERAARGDDGRLYPWGNGKADCEHAVISTRTGRSGCNRDGTLPVGSLEAGASPFGVLDLSGNVWEWTVGPRQRNPVLRGGAWNVDARQATTTWLYPYPASKGTPSTGFRCVR